MASKIVFLNARLAQGNHFPANVIGAVDHHTCPQGLLSCRLPTETQVERNNESKIRHHFAMLHGLYKGVRIS